MNTYDWIVSGRVQGVGFRYFTYTIASKYNLKGWVKNLSDGNVEIMVQGDIDRVSNLKKYIERGNMFIKVEKIEEQTLTTQEFPDFEIRY